MSQRAINVQARLTTAMQGEQQISQKISCTKKIQKIQINLKEYNFR